MTRLLVLVISLSVASASVAQGNRRPGAQPAVALPPVVERALSSSHIRYFGVRKLEFSNKLNGRKSHVEIVSHEGERTRVEFPPGSPLAGQVIVEDATQRQQYLPRQNVIQILPPRNDVTMVRLGNVLRRAVRQGWSVTTVQGDAIAGVSTELATVTDPKGLVRQRLWIDPNTGMILKRIVMSQLGEFQAGFEYTQIAFNPNLGPGVFAINHPGARIIKPEMRAWALAEKNGFSKTVLPAASGYRLENSRMVGLGDQRALLEVYSGPAGRVSLFHLRSMIDPMKLQQFAQGRYSVYTWQRNGETIALVGDIDERRLQDVAKQFGG